MYRELLNKIEKEAKTLPNTTSGALRKFYLSNLQKQINAELNNLGKDLESTIKSNMRAVASAACKDSASLLGSLGFYVEGLFSRVPGDVVQSIITGQVYDGEWSLSRSIWNHTSQSKKDINTIIAEGIAQNKSTYDIAKDLEKYVNPSAKKDWDWSKVYPGTAKKVDYNAQRLARTMVSHAYQQSFVQTTQKNPFVTRYRWDSSNSGRVCKLCESRDGVLFEKNELPLDHPNGMCTFIAVMESSMVEMADRLGDWAHGKDDPELEEYANVLYGPERETHKETKPEYKYHATKRSSIVGIIEQGLKPSKGHVGKGVYFANNAEDALWWTSETSTGGTTLLRVSKEFLLSKGYEEYSAEESGYGVAEGLINSKVPFDKIEVKVGNDWWTLSSYARQYKNTVYNRLSSAAQSRVDKQWRKETEEWLKKRANNQ